MSTTYAATLTPVEAADFLRRAPVTLERWRRLRLGPPFYRINGRVLYDRDDVARWMADQKAAGYEAMDAAP